MNYDILKIVCAFVFIIIAQIGFYLVNRLWWRPKKIEKCLKEQGFQGNSYNSIHGDLPEITRLTQLALSKPFSSLSHDIISRIMPFFHQTIQKYGMLLLTLKCLLLLLFLYILCSPNAIIHSSLMQLLFHILLYY